MSAIQQQCAECGKEIRWAMRQPVLFGVQARAGVLHLGGCKCPEKVYARIEPAPEPGAQKEPPRT